MTDQVQNQQQQQQSQNEVKQNDKEYNFRALEAKYQKQLEQERLARIEAEKVAREIQDNKVQSEEDDDQPYVDQKRLDKRLSSFEKKLEDKIDKKAEEKARFILEKNKQENWVKANPDFFDVLQHAEIFAKHDPELAETILAMPEGFERQKLVYKSIKALGLHKPPEKQSTIQDKIDANRRSPYYQPSGVGSSPYTSGGDFSSSGQKQAYAKMQELKSKLRI